MLTPLLLLIACTPKSEPEPDEEKDFSCPEGTVWLGQECGEPEELDSELSGSDDDTGPIDTEPPERCRVEINETFPPNGATNAFYRTPVEFHFSRDDASAVLSVDGVPGTSEVGDRRVVFTPDAPFAPSTTYTASLSYCDGRREAAISFTTSSAGSSVDPDALSGETWTLDLTSGRFVEPEGVGSVMQGYLEGGLLVDVVQVDSDNLDLRMANADERGAQDLCVGTADFSTDFSENPFFSFGPQDTQLVVGGLELSMDQMVFSGAISPDGAALEGVSIGGSVDTRPLVDLVEEGGSPDAVCEILMGFGISCGPCRSDGGEFCIDMLLLDLTGEETSTSVTDVPGDCHESCLDADGQCPETGCSTTGRGGAWLGLLALLGLAARSRSAAKLRPAA